MSKIDPSFNRTAGADGGGFVATTPNRRTLKVMQVKRVSDDLLIGMDALAGNDQHMMMSIQNQEDAKKFNRLYIRPPEDAISSSLNELNITSNFLEHNYLNDRNRQKPGLVSHQGQPESPLAKIHRREGSINQDAINITFHQQHSIMSKDQGQIQQQVKKTNLNYEVLSEQQLNNQRAVHNRIDQLLFAQPAPPQQNQSKIPIVLSHNKNSMQYYHPQLVAQVYGLDLNEAAAKKNFDLAKSTNNQERSYPQNIRLRQATQTAMNFISHRPGIKSEQSNLEKEQLPQQVSAAPSSSVLSRDKFWYLDESIYRLKHGNNGDLHDHDNNNEGEHAAAVPKQLQETIEYFMNHDKRMNGKQLQVVGHFNRQAMKQAVQSIHSQINNKDHSLSGIQASARKSENMQQKPKNINMLPLIQLNDQSKEDISSENKDLQVQIDKEIPDPRHYKRMHPNYYFINKDDVGGRSETYKVNVLKTANRSKFKAFFSTAASMGNTSRTSLDKQYEDPAITRFKNKFLNSNPISSQRSQSVTKKVVNLRSQLSPSVDEQYASRSVLHQRQTSYQQAPMSYNELSALALEEQSPYRNVSPRNINDSNATGRGWKRKQLDRPVYMKVLPQFDRKRYQSVLQQQSQDQNRLTSQQVSDNEDDQQHRLQHFSSNVTSSKNMLLIKQNSSQQQQQQLQQSLIKFKKLEDLPSYRKKQREHEELIKWQQMEQIREQQRQQDCEALVKVFVEKLGEDTKEATDNIQKLYQRDPSSKSPIHTKLPAYMGKKKHFKMDHELNNKINQIRTMQGWNNEKKVKSTRIAGINMTKITENLSKSPRDQGNQGVPGTRLITQLDKFAVYGMFEKQSQKQMTHMNSLIRKIADGAEISEKEMEEDSIKSERSLVEEALID